MREKNVYKGMLDSEEMFLEKETKNRKIKSGDFILFDNDSRRKQKRNKPIRDSSKRHDFEKFLK